MVDPCAFGCRRPSTKFSSRLNRHHYRNVNVPNVRMGLQACRNLPSAHSPGIKTLSISTPVHVCLVLCCLHMFRSDYFFHYYCYWKSFCRSRYHYRIVHAQCDGMVARPAGNEHNGYPAVHGYIWHRHKSIAILLLFYFCSLTTMYPKSRNFTVRHFSSRR